MNEIIPRVKIIQAKKTRFKLLKLRYLEKPVTIFEGHALSVSCSTDKIPPFFLFLLPLKTGDYNPAPALFLSFQIPKSQIICQVFPQRKNNQVSAICQGV
jgi:hypothetical protein